MTVLGEYTYGERYKVRNTKQSVIFIVTIMFATLMFGNDC